MYRVLSFVIATVGRWLSGSERPAATMDRWYHRGRRLKEMLSVARSADEAMLTAYNAAYARVLDVGDAGRKVKAAGGLMAAHRVYRRSRHEFEDATGDFVMALTAAEVALWRLEPLEAEARMAVEALDWLNARVASEAPPDVYPLLSPDIVRAGEFVDSARCHLYMVAEGRDEFPRALKELTEEHYR